MAGEIVATLALGIWIYLILGRGRFWLAGERDSRDEPAPPSACPRVIAVIPARDEVETIGTTMRSLLEQAYVGLFSVVLVDDECRDGTAAAARATAEAMGAAARLTVVAGRPLPSGWTGKLWAVAQGVEHATAPEPPEFLLLTDADITYAADALSHLVALSQAGGYGLISLFAKLRFVSLAERCFV